MGNDRAAANDRDARGLDDLARVADQVQATDPADRVRGTVFVRAVPAIVLDARAAATLSITAPVGIPIGAITKTGATIAGAT